MKGPLKTIRPNHCHKRPKANKAERARLRYGSCRTHALCSL